MDGGDGGHKIKFDGSFAKRHGTPKRMNRPFFFILRYFDADLKQEKKMSTASSSFPIDVEALRREARRVIDL